MVGPLAGLLLKGVVTGSPLQPFEVHLSFQRVTLREAQKSAGPSLCALSLVTCSEQMSCTQVMADLHLKGMAPVFVHKPFFRLPVVLHPLAAAGIHGSPQGGHLTPKLQASVVEGYQGAHSGGV
ncbi:uncharacterized protein EMH_0058280 [Eimeria mitis]|uniref:Uncharacterized protein n=1 Tax=Eimeria mitis TaxID=44415 RepID=U6K3X1_9EIME|nr:uncharacterized protein EMH_0058280 [Eimeria mitis]CDJ30453.1 hypothetical protein EMH_0058280 [Eimeria mitis]